MFFDSETLLWLLAAAVFGFWFGRVTAVSKSDRRLLDAEKRRHLATLLGGLKPELRRDVQGLLSEGRMIEAVKRVREDTGLGLKHAKELVDALRRSPEA